MRRRRIVKILLLGSLVVALILAFVVFRKRRVERVETSLDTATLAFSPTQINTSPGDTFQILILLNTGNQLIVGTDVVVKFDETNLTLRDITQPPHPILKTFVPIVASGTAFDKTEVINTANSTGDLRFGVVTYDLETGNADVTFSGAMNPLATLTFKVKANSSTETIKPITFHYVNTLSVNDSNVVARFSPGSAKDVLIKPSSSVAITK